MSLKPVYRQSTVKDFLRCGLYYEFRHVQKLPTRGNASMTMGSAVDFAVNASLTQKIATGQDHTLPEILENAANEFDRLTPETDFDGKKVEDCRMDVLRLAKLYFEVVAPKVDPATVQESFLLEGPTGEYLLSGTMDLVDKQGFVRDLKTTKDYRTANEFYKLGGIQPGLYTWAYAQTRGQAPAGFQYDILTRDKKAQYLTLTGTVTPEQHEFVFKTIDNVHRAIQAGVALPASEGAYWCKQDACPFWDRCKGRQS